MADAGKQRLDNAIAKLANRLAKKAPKTGGVLDLSQDPAWLEKVLAKAALTSGVGSAQERVTITHKAGGR